MKYLKFAIVGMCLIGGLNAFGQEGEKMTPEAKAEKMTIKLVEKLELDANQKEKVNAINLEFVQSANALKANSEVSDDDKKSEFKTLKEDYKASLKEVLTEEQFAEFSEMKKNHKSKKTLEEKARAKTDKMTEQLGLNAEQEAKLYDLNVKVARKIQAIKKNDEFSDEKKKKFIKGNKQDYKRVLKSILTEDQMERLEELKKKKKEAKAEKLEDK